MLFIFQNITKLPIVPSHMKTSFQPFFPPDLHIILLPWPLSRCSNIQHIFIIIFQIPCDWVVRTMLKYMSRHRDNSRDRWLCCTWLTNFWSATMLLWQKQWSEDVLMSSSGAESCLGSWSAFLTCSAFYQMNWPIAHPSSHLQCQGKPSCISWTLVEQTKPSCWCHH